MRKILLALCVMAAASPLSARGVYVPGYVRQNGTYVQPHYRTSPNSTLMDNYSTRGNVNPYTGRAGTVNPYSTYPSYRAPSYPSYNYQPYQTPSNGGYGSYGNPY